MPGDGLLSMKEKVRKQRGVGAPASSVVTSTGSIAKVLFSRSRRKTLSMALLAAALTVGQSTVRAATPVTVGGPFVLTSPDGATVTDQTYRGKWLLVYFGYTYCPDTCPTTLAEVAAALKVLGSEAVSLQPIFITIDPQRDTPRVMGEYTQSFDPRIVGLTGTQAQIDTVVAEYGAYAVQRRTGAGSDEYVFDHSIYLYVVDQRGQFVRAFDTGWSADRMAATMRDLIGRP